MSAVVAIKANGRVYLAADRLKKRLGFYWRVTSEFNFRIRKMGGDLLIGSVGPLSQTQRFFLNEDWFTPPKGVAFDKEFLVTSVLPKYIKLLRKNDLLEKPETDSDDYPHMNASFLVAKGEDLYYINSDFAVFTIKEFAVICDEGQKAVMEQIVYSFDKSEPERFLTEVFAKGAEKLGTMVSEIALIDTVDSEFRLLGGSK